MVSHNNFYLICCQALNGGFLEWGHVEMIRNTISRNMDTTKTFAVWRIDPPWFPKTKKGIGKRMGGGRPGIGRYTVPVKTDRVIVEMGGKVTFEEVSKLPSCTRVLRVFFKIALLEGVILVVRFIGLALG